MYTHANVSMYCTQLYKMKYYVLIYILDFYSTCVCVIISFTPLWYKVLKDGTVASGHWQIFGEWAYKSTQKLLRPDSTQPHETQTPIEEEGYKRTNFYYEESREIIICKSLPSPPLPSCHCHWRGGQVLTMRNGHPRLLSQLVEQWVLPKTARTGTTERTPAEQNSFCPSGYCALTTGSRSASQALLVLMATNAYGIQEHRVNTEFKSTNKF